MEVPWWQDLINGVEKPIMNRGFVTVPSGPGLGFTTLNEDLIRKHLDGGYCEPTSEWDKDVPTTASGAARKNPALSSGADADWLPSRAEFPPGDPDTLVCRNSPVDQGTAKRLGINLVGVRLNGGPQRLNVLRARPGLGLECLRNPTGETGDLQAVGICRFGLVWLVGCLCGHPGGLGFSRLP